MVSVLGGVPFEALTPLSPLSRRERGANCETAGTEARRYDPAVFLFSPSSLSLGEEGRGGEGFGGHAVRGGQTYFRCPRRARSMRRAESFMHSIIFSCRASPRSPIVRACARTLRARSSSPKARRAIPR